MHSDPLGLVNNGLKIAEPRARIVDDGLAAFQKMKEEPLHAYALHKGGTRLR